MKRHTSFAKTLARYAGRQPYATMPEIYVKRITLFKVAKDEDIEKVLKQYEILRKTAVKVRGITEPPLPYDKTRRLPHPVSLL